MSQLSVQNPYSLSEFQSVEFHSSADLESALAAAKSFHLSNGISRKERIDILSKVKTVMYAERAELAITAVQEGGKPLVDTIVEVDRAITGVQLAIDHLKQMSGSMIPMEHHNEERMAFTSFEPIGVVASISAFNHPLNLAVHQVVTAIAAGCPVIMKPALTTPLSAIRLGEILLECGVPKEMCHVLILTDELSEQLATDERVSYLSFIGSAKVGWYLRSKIAPGTHIALEHGGIAPVIIDKGVSMDTYLQKLLKGGFYHAGQVCVSVQRVYVHASEIDVFIAAFAEEAKCLSVGDPLKETTDLGPLILTKEVDRVEAWVKEAIAEGAELICGGERIGQSCYKPTILLNPSKESKVSQEEIFGPVVCVYSYETMDEAISMANATDFHFQASVFTDHIETAKQTAKALKAKTVLVNDHTAFRVDWMPFGGAGKSGIGVGGIQYSIEEMSLEKLIVL